MTLDALRGDVYAAGYEWDGATLVELAPHAIVPRDAAAALAQSLAAGLAAGRPHARAAGPLADFIARAGPVDLATWEPDYGRLAEAQVRWEAAHGGPLAT